MPKEKEPNESKRKKMKKVKSTETGGEKTKKVSIGLVIITSLLLICVASSGY